MEYTLLRAELFALATVAKAYYLVHGGSLASGSLEVQNFCRSVEYCLAPDAPVEDTAHEVLVKLLEVGIAIIQDDAAAASIGVNAALSRARDIWQHQVRAGTVAMNLHQALIHSHTAECIASDGVRYQVQEGVNFCVRRIAPGEFPDSFAAINLGPALQIAANRGWLLAADAEDWMPVQHTPAPVPAMEAR